MSNWLRWKNDSQQSSFKSDIKRNTPYLLPTIKKNNDDIERVNMIKYLGVLSDENLSWKEQ